ncbi:MAG: ACT domain-containing protein [Gemmobacter sp.]
MVAGAVPDRMPGLWVFASLADPGRAVALAPQALASFREAEGVSLILPLDVAAAEGFDTALPMACLTLRVVSALDGVGLTAAVAAALAAQGIPANVVAAFHHDHVLVPADRAEAAIAALSALAAGRAIS